MQLNLTEEQKVRNKRIGKIIEDVLYFCVLAAIAFCLLSFLITGKTSGKPNVFGLRHFYIASESMEPVINTQQFVLTKVIAAEEVKEGDIIAYKDDASNKIIIHRVTDIRVNENGQMLFTFKGDNNDFADPYDVTADMIMYKVIWY